ncbi:AAA family ATPase [Mycobacterium vicinigordonae]|uniref:AAA family ATPase n=1 Tax=Mycobacterium vicinigordonae TaxID=1719132 RepID=A0A7D6E373_9MYCO|nr:LuxR family transcriptional regulator [Mycobacterium vicinigordonae]QLL06262.1 AAA family ATPase [Mycobacterium vicinigordonae]
MRWEFVGRDAEIRVLTELITSTAPCARGAVLAGKSGVGKTALAVECLRQVEGPSFATFHVSASRAAAFMPLGAVASLLPVSQYLGNAITPAQMLSAAAAELVRRAGDRRLVLLVDDAHLLDDATATLIHQLAASGSAFVLGTVRSTASAPGPVVSLWKDGLVERIEVVGLDEESIAELVTTVLGGQVDQAVPARLAERCQGNILFLRELLLGAIADHNLVQDSGIWFLARPLTPSDRLVELVELRLEGLSPQERTLLELLSWGEPLEITELSALTGISDIEQLERQGFVSSRIEGDRLEVRMAHPVYGDVVRARTPAIRVPSITTRLADTVEAQGSCHPRDILRVATWRLHGGGGPAELMLAAATAAQRDYNFILAEALAQRALAAGAGFDAAILLAELATQQGRTADGHDQLLRLAAKTTTDAQRGRVTIARLNNEAFYGGLIDEGLRIVKEADVAIDDPLWLDWVHSMRAGLVLAKWGPRQAIESVEPLLHRANGRPLAWTCQVASPAHARFGLLLEALSISERGYTTAESAAGPSDWFPWTHLFFRSQAFAWWGRLDEADQLARDQYNQALHDGSVEKQAWFAFALTTEAADRGNVCDAVKFGKEAVALFHNLTRPLMEYVSLTALASALALNGQAEEAQQTLAALDALGLPRLYLAGIDLELARAWTAAAANDLPQACKFLEEAVSVGQRIGDRVGAVNALHMLGRLGYSKDVGDRMQDLAKHVEGPLAAARINHTTALAEDDPNGLDAVSATFRGMGAYLLAAEAASDAAIAWRRRGKDRKAAASEFQAAASTINCAGLSPLALRGTTIRGLLTRAEQEAALLAAAGRSNKAIADQLYLSVRTVEGRLQRVYEKLGISSREQLASAVGAARSQ